MTSIEIAKKYVGEGWRLEPATRPEGIYNYTSKPIPDGAEWFFAYELDPKELWLDNGRYIGVWDGEVVFDG